MKILTNATHKFVSWYICSFSLLVPEDVMLFLFLLCIKVIVEFVFLPEMELQDTKMFPRKVSPQYVMKYTKNIEYLVHTVDM